MLAAAPAGKGGDEFDGVQPAALDQPRVNVIIRKQGQAAPLSGKTDLGETSNVEAFLDTGASGVLLSEHTANLLSVARERIGNAEARFEDVGVGGGDQFVISEPLTVAIAASDADVDVAPETIRNVYRLSFGPVRTEIGPIGGGMLNALLREAMGDLDVVGMPAMSGKVVVMNADAVNKIADKIHTAVYDPKSDAGQIPKMSRHIRLSFVDFAAFTTTTPATAAAPTINANPFIGPDPVKRAFTDHTPPISIAENGKQSPGSFLLDTGAVASMISRKQAAAIGITYKAGTENTDDPQLSGVPMDQQFTMTIGGIGGSKKAAGFYLDRLTLQTVEGRPISYIHAPVLISDITVKSAQTGTTLTLDGVFGMNFLVASAKISGDLLPDIDHITPGPYHWIVFDAANGLLGLE
ncbi:MAG: aspartyl protease family protein [Phycisphaerae bacterium]|nr:aspartyl protease family protein [Phycisphaerae bacterium]